MKLIVKMRMELFGILMLTHWLEHIAQVIQVYVLHMHRECSMGLLGMKYPWLVRTETLHFGFAVFTTLGAILAGWHYFENDKGTELWVFGIIASIWHLFEHSLLFGQALAHVQHPTSILQLVFPRIELHLFYNTVVTGLLLAGFVREKWPCSKH